MTLGHDDSTINIVMAIIIIITMRLLHPFNNLFSWRIWVNWYQKGKISLDLYVAKDDGVWGWQWHQLDHKQTICTSLQTTTSSLNLLFLAPNQQYQSTKNDIIYRVVQKKTAQTLLYHTDATVQHKIKQISPIIRRG